MSVAVTFVLIPIILLIGLGIPLAIGLYVYRDANRRGMNAALWTLVAILAPSLIGFIIYLLVRNSNSDMLCPRCDTPVKEDYVICPNCGAKLQPYCSNCATPLQPDWKVCPRCTQPITEIYDDVVVPQRHKDKSLGKILVAVLVIPVLLIVVLILSVSVFKVSTSSGGGSSSVMTEVSWHEWTRSLRGTSDSKVIEWTKTVYEENDIDKAYVLEYMEPTEEETLRYYYAIYLPATVAGAKMGYGVESGLFRDIIKFEVEDDLTRIEQMEEEDIEIAKRYVYCVEIDIDRTSGLEVYYNGRKLECEISSVDYNPTGTLFDES